LISLRFQQIAVSIPGEPLHGMDVSLPASGPSVDDHDGTLLYPEKPKKCEHIPISGKIKYIIYLTI
jgi:hypothetical protein